MAGELRHRRVPSEDGDEGAAASQGPDPAAGNGKAGTASEGAEPRRGKRDALGWLEWGRGWMAVVGEFLFQRIAASHLANPLELPPLDGVSVVVTGATSGIGLEIARCLLCFPPPRSLRLVFICPHATRCHCEFVVDGSFRRPLREDSCCLPFHSND
jgi:hypothetical protein